MDSSKDLRNNGVAFEFDTTDKEDVVFITQVKKSYS